MNIGDFSKLIGEQWNTNPDIIKNYILANISIGLTRTSEMKRDINKLYIMDKLKYYNAASNSTCISHVIMTKGSLEQEIYARKALGILLIAEVDANLRNTVISLLRKHNPLVFNAVKKSDKKFLIKKYTQLDEVTRRIEARLDASVYFYFSIYRSADAVDQGFIKSIIEDIKNFEFYDPMSIDITKDIEMNKSKIQEIKTIIKRDYGKINNFKDILNSDNENIEELGVILQNLFIINKLDINNLFYNSDFLNIDDIILSYLKLNYNNLDIDLTIQSLITGIFIKSLINEYKKAKSLYFENNQETLFFKIDSLEENLNKLQDENKQLNSNLHILKEEKAIFNETLESNINKLNKNHKLEINNLQNKIKELENQLIEEKEYRNELNALREYIFKVNNNYVPSICTEKLEHYICYTQILIIGGPREWRRKFREKYPNLKTLNGFNEKFEISILKNVDFIFFYTGFMNHATYTRAMNFIRLNKIKFGYIGKTNIELVEEEIIEEIKKYSE